MKIYPFYCVVIERDRWSGPSIDSVTGHDTKEAASAAANKVNDQNTEASAPEVYYIAEVFTDNKYAVYVK